MRSLCIQYRESDLEFVSRLLAEEGLSYHFRHLEADAAAKADDAGQARHVMVITDRAAPRASLGELRFAGQHAGRTVDTMQELGRRIKTRVDELLGRAKKEAGNYEAAPGGPNKHGQGDKEPPRHLRPKSNYAPPLKSRHSIRSIRQGGVKKSRNTVAEPHIDMNADAAAINRGEGVREGNHFTINGRTYELTNGDHLVPTADRGFMHRVVESLMPWAFSISSETLNKPAKLLLVLRGLKVQAKP